MGLFNREAQILAQKMGFTYDQEVAREDDLLMLKRNFLIINESILNIQKGSFGYLCVTEFLFLQKTTQHSLKGVEHALSAV